MPYKRVTRIMLSDRNRVRTFCQNKFPVVHPRIWTYLTTKTPLMGTKKATSWQNAGRSVKAKPCHNPRLNSGGVKPWKRGALLLDTSLVKAGG